ncbi:MAG: phasin family protein [Pseudomonadota bacterium]
MSINLEQFSASNKATVDSLLAVANTALATAERLAALNLGAARTALEDSASATKAVLAVKNPNDAAALQQSLVQPAAEKVADYSRALFEISSDSQQQFAKLLEAQFADFQKQVSGLVDQAAKTAPAGSESIVAAMQQAINSANSAFGNMTAMAKQFSASAQANIAAATKKK